MHNHAALCVVEHGNVNRISLCGGILFCGWYGSIRRGSGSTRPASSDSRIIGILKRQQESRSLFRVAPEAAMITERGWRSPGSVYLPAEHSLLDECCKTNPVPLHSKKQVLEILQMVAG